MVDLPGDTEEDRVIVVLDPLQYPVVQQVMEVVEREVADLERFQDPDVDQDPSPPLSYFYPMLLSSREVNSARRILVVLQVSTRERCYFLDTGSPSRLPVVHH